MMEDATKEIKTYELVLKGSSEEGLLVNSLVADPANELPFFAFSKEKEEPQMLAFGTDEQRIVTGILMVPNKLIPRRDSNGDMYNVFFSEQTLREMGKQFAKNGFFNNVNLEHDGDNVSGVYMTEIWFTGKQDKIHELFYKAQVPAGSIAASFWVENDAIWADVKAGKYKGFSIEGMFNKVLVPVEMSKDEPIVDPMTEFENIILNENTSDEEKDMQLARFLIKNLASGVTS